jgi:hypothetical protein
VFKNKGFIKEPFVGSVTGFAILVKLPLEDISDTKELILVISAT